MLTDYRIMVKQLKRHTIFFIWSIENQKLIISLTMVNKL